MYLDATLTDWLLSLQRLNLAIFLCCTSGLKLISDLKKDTTYDYKVEVYKHERIQGWRLDNLEPILFQFSDCGKE